MVGKCHFACVIMLICSCLGQPVRPLFIKFAGCSKPAFFPQVSIVTYRQHLLNSLMRVFRLRHPNDAIGGPEVMAACVQAAALLNAYHSLRSAYLDYHMQNDPHAGMSEDSAAWMAGRFNLMLQEDHAVASDKKLQKGVKWCIDSTLVVQQILSQRAHTDVNESPISPGNAFNNLLDASRTGGASHTRRTAQYLLSRCRDESKETSAQIHAWAALSVGIAETFFRGQLTCAVDSQEGSETNLSLVKAALSLGWGKMKIEDVLEPHALLLQAVGNIGKSKLLTDPDKKRVQKNCSGLGMPQMQPFWPFDADPQHLDEALLSMYSIPSNDDNGQGHVGRSKRNAALPPEPHERSGRNGRREGHVEPPNKGSEPSEEQPYPRAQPPPPPPPVHREEPPLQVVEEDRPHQSVVLVPVGKREESPSPYETEEPSAPTQEEQPYPQGAEEEPPVPPPHEKEQPSAAGHSQEEVEDKPPSDSTPIVLVVPSQTEGQELPKPTPPYPKEDHENPHESTPPGPPPAPPKEPKAKSTESPNDYSGSHSSPVSIPQEDPDEDNDGHLRPRRKLPERIRVGSANERFPAKGSELTKPKLKRSQSDEYKPHREVSPQPRRSKLFSHRLLSHTGSETAP